MIDKVRQPVRIAALADLHVTERSRTKYQELFRKISQEADLLLLGGDLTDHGHTDEAEVLKAELHACTIPTIAVLGNHDFETGHEDQIKTILRSGNVCLLDDEEYVYKDVGFAGVKGFGGGFGKYMLGAFGEKATKAFVDESIYEQEQLEVHLDKIDHVAKKVVLMHYSPTPTTLKGEALEIYPFLGSTRLEETIDRYDVSVVFHGHAHYGFPQGKTLKGIPVYNVAYPLLKTTIPEKSYRLLNL